MTDGSDGELIHRKLDVDARNPGIEVVGAVADIRGTDATELATLHDCIDGVLDRLFSNPPSPEAEMRVTFNYENYRVGVAQDGDATFVREE